MALDLETTGLDPSVDVAVEVGAVRFRGDGTVLDEFGTLISGPPSSSDARACHQIEEADRRGAPDGAEVWAELLAFLQGSVVVAHNADFEQPFIEAAARRYGLPLPDLLMLCTLQEARRHFDGRAFSLKSLHRHATGEWRSDTHQALSDARATKDVLLWMIETSPQPLRVTGGKPSAEAATGASCMIRCRPAPLREPSVSALLRALPQSPKDRRGDPAEIEAYLALLNEVLDDGRLTYQEAAQLSEHAVRTGLTGPQIKLAHEEAFRDVFGDPDLTGTSPSRLKQMAGAAEGLGLEELALDLRSRLPEEEFPERPVPRLLRGRRYAFLGNSPEITGLKSRALANGAPEVKNVTKTVIWVAADDPGGESKQHSNARSLGIPLLDLTQAASLLEEDIASAEQKRFEREQQIAAQEAAMERYQREAARRQEEEDAYWAPTWRDHEHPKDPGPPSWW